MRAVIVILAKVSGTIDPVRLCTDDKMVILERVRFISTNEFNSAMASGSGVNVTMVLQNDATTDTFPDDPNCYARHVFKPMAVAAYAATYDAWMEEDATVIPYTQKPISGGMNLYADCPAGTIMCMAIIDYQTVTLTDLEKLKSLLRTD